MADRAHSSATASTTRMTDSIVDSLNEALLGDCAYAAREPDAEFFSALDEADSAAAADEDFSDDELQQMSGLSASRNRAAHTHTPELLQALSSLRQLVVCTRLIPPVSFARTILELLRTSTDLTLSHACFSTLCDLNDALSPHAESTEWVVPIHWDASHGGRGTRSSRFTSSGRAEGFVDSSVLDSATTSAASALSSNISGGTSGARGKHSTRATAAAAADDASQMQTNQATNSNLSRHDLLRREALARQQGAPAAVSSSESIGPPPLVCVPRSFPGMLDVLAGGYDVSESDSPACTPLQIANVVLRMRFFLRLLNEDEQNCDFRTPSHLLPPHRRPRIIDLFELRGYDARDRCKLLTDKFALAFDNDVDDERATLLVSLLRAVFVALQRTSDASVSALEFLQPLTLSLNRIPLAGLRRMTLLMPSAEFKLVWIDAVLSMRFAGSGVSARVAKSFADAPVDERKILEFFLQQRAPAALSQLSILERDEWHLLLVTQLLNSYCAVYAPAASLQPLHAAIREFIQRYRAQAEHSFAIRELLADLEIFTTL